MSISGLLFALFVAAGVAVSAMAQPDSLTRQWPETDFSIRAIDDWSEIRPGGPGRDGIPAVDTPRFAEVSAETRLSPREPVIALELDGERPRAYPIRYLTWHEIVNDVVGGLPVAVTFCPLCNSAMTFDRRVDGRRLSFGVSGFLRNSDMVMYDRETESWWQQAVGRGIVGKMTGATLTPLPSWMESWEAFRSRNPDGLVMEPPGRARPYGQNPYSGYDTSRAPMLYSGENPPHGIHPLARVVRVGDRAWPLERLAEENRIAEAGMELRWEGAQASALDSASIARGREVGAIRVRDGQGRDVAHDVMFAFAFHAFWPEGEWMLGR